MSYIDELKQIRKDMKKELAKAGVKASIRGGRGTATFWTDIEKPRGKNQWSAKELKVLQKDFGIMVGHPSNDIVLPMEKLKAKLGGYQARSFKKKPKYKKFREDFIQTGMKQSDWGTCCLGAGTVVQKGKKDIDFINQLGQSDARNAVAEKLMEQRARKLGLKLKHESGTMD